MTESVLGDEPRDEGLSPDAAAIAPIIRRVMPLLVVDDEASNRAGIALLVEWVGGSDVDPGLRIGAVTALARGLNKFGRGETVVAMHAALSESVSSSDALRQVFGGYFEVRHLAALTDIDRTDLSLPALERLATSAQSTTGRPGDLVEAAVAGARAAVLAGDVDRERVFLDCYAARRFPGMDDEGVASGLLARRAYLMGLAGEHDAALDAYRQVIRDFAGSESEEAAGVSAQAELEMGDELYILGRFSEAAKAYSLVLDRAAERSPEVRQRLTIRSLNGRAVTRVADQQIELATDDAAAVSRILEAERDPELRSMAITGLVTITMLLVQDEELDSALHALDCLTSPLRHSPDREEQDTLLLAQAARATILRETGADQEAAGVRAEMRDSGGLLDRLDTLLLDNDPTGETPEADDAILAELAQAVANAPQDASRATTILQTLQRMTATADRASASDN